MVQQAPHRGGVHQADRLVAVLIIGVLHRDITRIGYLRKISVTVIGIAERKG